MSRAASPRRSLARFASVARDLAWRTRENVYVTTTANAKRRSTVKMTYAGAPSARMATAASYRGNAERRLRAGGNLQETLEPVRLLEQQVEVQQVVGRQRGPVVGLAHFLRQL